MTGARHALRCACLACAERRAAVRLATQDRRRWPRPALDWRGVPFPDSVAVGGAGVVHAERLPDLGEAKPLDGPLLPGLALLVDGNTPLVNKTVEAGSGNPQPADSLTRADHRFLLHDPTVADVPIVPIVPIWYDGVVPSVLNVPNLEDCQ